MVMALVVNNHKLLESKEKKIAQACNIQFPCVKKHIEEKKKIIIEREPANEIVLICAYKGLFTCFAINLIGNFG